MDRSANRTRRARAKLTRVFLAVSQSLPLILSQQVEWWDKRKASGAGQVDHAAR